MKLPILNLDNVSMTEQLDKIAEEVCEVINAFERIEPTVRLKSELLNLIQASFGMLFKLGLSDKDFDAHYRKLRLRNLDFDGRIDISITKFLGDK